MTAGNVFMIFVSLIVLYGVGAFVSAKFFKRDQWPFKAKSLALPDHKTVLPPPVSGPIRRGGRGGAQK